MGFRVLREHYQQILDDHLIPAFGHRQLGAVKPKDVRDWYEATLADRPTMRSHAYSLLKTIMASAVNDEHIDNNPCRIVGAGRAKRVHKIRPASVEELGVLTEAMPEPLRLMVTLASWCALRFGETVELRRGDIDLSAEVIRIRRAAVRVTRRVDSASPPNAVVSAIGVSAAARSSYQITTPKSDAGIRDVSIPPHIIPAIEAHLAKYVDRGRDSLVFGRGWRASAAVHALPTLVPGQGAGGAKRPALARLKAQRCRAGRGDRRIAGRTDAASRAFDPAGGDEIPACGQRPSRRSRGAALQARQRRVDTHQSIATVGKT